MTDDRTRPGEPPPDAPAPEAPSPDPVADQVPAAPPTTGPDATVGGPAASAAAPGAIPGWRPGGQGPSGTGRTIGCILGAVILLFLGLVLASIIGLIFLGGQVQSILSGTVTFGTSGVECDVDGVATVLPANGPIYMAAYFTRDAQPGETIRIEVTTQGERFPLSEEPITATTRCLYLDIPSGEGAPGQYTFEFLSGDEVMATGTVTLSP